ncbi:helix-turn-helix domain-containing protein [Spirosoma validum]|uniref:Helix-turn-helix domain-containing protein n=1 Tax=Spirosoma validum TaxID=2771355 RepID=A0A927GHQ8_9BACT|nr:helix-turn-helix domain-containing protein [Spirosoma validum]MBD2757900.1 helix-turn-helix domain-containing protein [Spirosoma validum]
MQQPTTYADYQQLMAQIEILLQKATVGGGFVALNPDEATELAQLSELAEAYEDSIPLMPIKVPQSIPEMIEFKMYERKMKQREMAQLLEVPATRLSEILRGKRRVNLAMAKTLRTKLKIDADFILEHA